MDIDFKNQQINVQIHVVEIFVQSREGVWPVANTYMEPGGGSLISPSHLSINDIRDHNVLITLSSPLLAPGWGSLREFSP